MSLNGIMGIGISSVGVQDERKEIAREERSAQLSAGTIKLNNLSAVQQDFVTLSSGVGQVAPARAAGAKPSVNGQPNDRGNQFQAIA